MEREYQKFIDKRNNEIMAFKVSKEIFYEIDINFSRFLTLGLCTKGSVGVGSKTLNCSVSETLLMIRFGIFCLMNSYVLPLVYRFIEYNYEKKSSIYNIHYMYYVVRIATLNVFVIFVLLKAFTSSVSGMLLH